jgi:hypothetical protein
MNRKVAWVLLVLFAPYLTAQTLYFPPNAFCASHETEHCDRWYAPHLIAMQEPSLWELSKKRSDEIYRFLWLRTFHRPVSARLEIKSDGSGDLVIKVLSGSGDYNPGHLIQNRKIKAERESVDHFLDLLGKAGFWSAPTEQEVDGVGCDGAQWIMEATKNGQYHVVDRWSPDDGPYRKAALFLAINLGGLNPRYNDVY